MLESRENASGDHIKALDIQIAGLKEKLTEMNE